MEKGKNIEKQKDNINTMQTEQKGRESENQEKIVQELRETLQRLQAEFENYTKRAEKEKQEFRKYAEASLLKDLLPFIDSLDNAIEKIEKHEAASKEQAVNGVKELRKHFFRILEKHGLQNIESTGKIFNAELQECIESMHDK